MNDSVKMRFADSLADLEGDAQGARKGKGSAGRGERRAQRDAVEVLHHDVHRGAAGAAFRQLPGHHHLHDAGVRKVAGDLGLAMKAHDESAVGRQLTVENLDRDGAIHPCLKAAVHSPHRSDPDELLDANLTEQLDAQVGVGSFGGRGAERGAVPRAEKCVGFVFRATNRADASR